MEGSAVSFLFWGEKSSELIQEAREREPAPDRALLAQREEQRGMLSQPGASCTCTCWVWGQPPPGDASMPDGIHPGNSWEFPPTSSPPNGSKWLFTLAAVVSAFGLRIDCQFTQASGRIHNHQHLLGMQMKLSCRCYCVTVCLLCLL